MEEEYTEEEREEMEESAEDAASDNEESRMFDNEELRDSYGVPESEAIHNQHTFIANSLRDDDLEKVTFMSESELGRPLFNLRFLLDVEDITKYYLDDMFKNYEIKNKIAEYFRAKIDNMCSSGMSNQGFVQNLNVTRRMDSTRKRVKDIAPQLKGGRR